MKKACELCEKMARIRCEADEASLCWDCDAKVHAANFLVARHSRNLLCHVCQSPTPWSASGAKVGPAVSFCQNVPIQGSATAEMKKLRRRRKRRRRMRRNAMRRKWRIRLCLGLRRKVLRPAKTPTAAAAAAAAAKRWIRGSDADMRIIFRLTILPMTTTAVQQLHREIFRKRIRVGLECAIRKDSAGKKPPVQLPKRRKYTPSI
ncbi:hypothetical protein ABFS83_13G022800 [Erythranthe nasuta]